MIGDVQVEARTNTAHGNQVCASKVSTSSHFRGLMVLFRDDEMG